MANTDHLALAQEDLTIAESADSKREAYKRAAEHIAAHQKQSGDSLVRVAARLKRPARRVQELDQWRRSGYRTETPAAMNEGAYRAAKSHTRAILRDPEQRTEVIESLDEAERLAVAQAALEASEKEGKERKKRARTVREEHSTDPSATHEERIRLDLHKADNALDSAINVAEDATLPETRTKRLEARIAITRKRLDLLEMAVRNESDVDWDTELAQLNAREEETA